MSCLHLHFDQRAQTHPDDQRLDGPACHLVPGEGLGEPVLAHRRRPKHALTAPHSSNWLLRADCDGHERASELQGWLFRLDEGRL
jgi:hypothetical protein